MIYVIACDATGTMKIGYTAGNVEGRLADIQTCNPFLLRIIAQCAGDMFIERLLHRVMQPYHIAREWFWMFDESVDALDAAGVFDAEGAVIDEAHAEAVGRALRGRHRAHDLEALSLHRAKPDRHKMPPWTNRLTEVQAARHMHMSVNQIRAARLRGHTPPFIEHRNVDGDVVDVTYDASMIEDWREQNEARKNALAEQQRAKQEARANRAWVRKIAIQEEQEDAARRA